SCRVKTTEIAMTSVLATLDDSALIEMARAGQTESFTELIGRHQGVIKGRIKSIVRNPSDTDDVLQEVLFKVWRNLSTFRSESSFRTWLTRIAINEALMLRRRKGSTRPSETPSDFATFASPGQPTDQCLVQAEETRVLHRAVVRLPLKYREVLILR